MILKARFQLDPLPFILENSRLPLVLDVLKPSDKFGYQLIFNFTFAVVKSFSANSAFYSFF